MPPPLPPAAAAAPVCTPSTLPTVAWTGDQGWRKPPPCDALRPPPLPLPLWLPLPLPLPLRPAACEGLLPQPSCCAAAAGCGVAAASMPCCAGLLCDGARFCCAPVGASGGNQPTVTDESKPCVGFEGAGDESSNQAYKLCTHQKCQFAGKHTPVAALDLTACHCALYFRPKCAGNMHFVLT